MRISLALTILALLPASNVEATTGYNCDVIVRLANAAKCRSPKQTCKLTFKVECIRNNNNCIFKVGEALAEAVRVDESIKFKGEELVKLEYSSACDEDGCGSPEWIYRGNGKCAP